LIDNEFERWHDMAGDAVSFISFSFCIFEIQKRNMEGRLEKTSKSDQKIAKALKTKVTEASVEVAKVRRDTVALSIEGYKQSLKIPKSAVKLFFMILDGMAEGNSIALLLSDSKGKADIGTQQTADLLGVSRPHVVSLLENGEIPFFKVGTHRRIQLKDLIEYNKKIKKNRADKLDFLAAQAQDLNMGY
jgi:excisionase family DNA binding protein